MKRVIRSNPLYINKLLSIYGQRREFWNAVIPDKYKYDLVLQDVFVTYLSNNEIQIHHDDNDESNNSPNNLYLMSKPAHGSITQLYAYEDYINYAQTLLPPTQKSGQYLSLCLRNVVELTPEILVAKLDQFVITELPQPSDRTATPMFKHTLNEYVTRFIQVFDRSGYNCEFVTISSYTMTSNDVMDATLIFDTDYGDMEQPVTFNQRYSTFWDISEFSKPDVDAKCCISNLIESYNL